MSTAISPDRISKIVGYQLTAGQFNVSSPNLPQRIAILAEANDANQTQAGLDVAGRQITSAQKAGQLYGYGSPIHQIARILFPVTGSRIGGIPVIVYPQEEAASATGKTIEITPTGTATASGTHAIVINGRRGIDGQTYELNISTGDTASVIAGKIEDIINGVLSAPVTASEATGVVTLTAKWNGLTSNAINVSIDTGESSLGVTYGIANDVAGAGTPSIDTALANFNEQWNTIVINSYGAVSAVMSSLESFNGKPGEPSTGRYSGDVFKPMIAITGSTLSDLDALIAITSPRKNQLTLAFAPAPASSGLALEAAANMAVLQANVAQNAPHLDVQSQVYPDMPTPDSIGDMSDKDERDRLVKNGCSTVELSGGAYKVVDFVTTYHPDGELPPQYRYPRDLNIDWNMRFGELLIVQANVIDHLIANDKDIVTAAKVVKPKQLKQLLQSYADSSVRRGLIVDAPFMQDSITVNIDSNNPNRMNSFYRYKRSGFARISSTTAEAGFNFGNV